MSKLIKLKLIVKAGKLKQKIPFLLYIKKRILRIRINLKCYLENTLSKDSIIFSRKIGFETKSLNPVAINFSLSPGNT